MEKEEMGNTAGEKQEGEKWGGGEYKARKEKGYIFVVINGNEIEMKLDSNYKRDIEKEV